MRVITICAVLCTATAFGGTASIVSSFRSPCSNAWGIDYYGGDIYHADGNYYKIYRTNTVGSILGTIATSMRPFGIDRTRIEFWTDNPNAQVYHLSTTGSTISSFKAPGARSGGVTYGEGFIWYTSGPSVFKLTTNGSVVKSFELSGVLNDICWTKSCIWIASSNKTIYQTDESGKIIDSISGFVSVPYGISHDGSYLWYTGYKTVYKAKISPTAVEPASLGKVKALWR